MRYRVHPPGTKIRDGIARWYGGEDSTKEIAALWIVCGRNDTDQPPAFGEVYGTWDCWILTEEPRFSFTGAQVLAVAGIAAALVSFVGGTVFGSPVIAGVGGLIMLLGNAGALLAERQRK